MKYESKKTEHGNVGVSYNSQEDADRQAKQMDDNGCKNCYSCLYCSYCSNCSYCADCSRCSNCSYCSGCSDCSGCSVCSNCSYCSDCSGCSRCSVCSNCSYCSDCSGCSNCSRCSGILRWSGDKASALIAINGLKWPIATDGKHIQIGCRHHSVKEWELFNDDEIDKMESGALEFWTTFKPTIMAMAAYRSNLDAQ